MPEVVLCDVEHENEPIRHVIIEVVHPTLRFCEWRERYLSHTANGVAEYYLIHPGPPMDVEMWCRTGDQLAPVRKKHGWVSPRLGIRFELDGDELSVFDRDGQPLREVAEMLAKFRELGVDPDKV